MRTVILFALFALASAASDFYLCEVVVPNFCATSVLTRDCLPEPALTLRGNSVSLTDNYNFISFGDFNAYSSDTEGRVAVRNTGNLIAAYSIGALINSKGPGAVDNQVPYSAVFGRDLYWGSGRLYPDGMTDNLAAYPEELYVGGTFNTPAADLAERRTNDAQSAGTFDAEFDNARAFYTQVQAALAAVADNVVIDVLYGTATITCPAGVTSYSGSIKNADLGTVSSYAFVGCAAEIQMVINVLADGNQVNFHSGAMNVNDRRPERTVFNVLGSGVVDFASVGFEGSVLAPNYVYQQNGGYTHGIVIVADAPTTWQINKLSCVRPTPPATPSPCVSFEETCAGTLFTAPGATIQGDSREYNLISFKDFVANTGDVEGRVLVRNDFTVGSGFSVGDKISTSNDVPDRRQSYSLIAGGDCKWNSGALYPQGDNIPFAAQTEYAFCGHSFTAPADLMARQGGSCPEDNLGCLESIFDELKGCYDGYADSLSKIQDNTQIEVKESALVITCNNDASADSYAVTIDSSIMSQYTYTITSNCNYQAYWTVNIVGNGDVTFSGDSFPAVPGAVVYNVQGCRTINVRDTSLNGHLLSTCSVLNQTGGVILGKVVVGDVAMSLQINKEDTCRTVSDVIIVVGNDQDKQVPYETTFCPIGFGLIQVEDLLVLVDGKEYIVNWLSEGCVSLNNGEVDEEVALLIQKQSKVGTITKASNSANSVRPNIPNNTSSASIASISFVLVAIVALLF